MVTSTEYKDNQNAYKILGILMDYAPNGPCQERCTQVYHNAQRHGATPRELVTAMSSALSDGLVHGNWPWLQKKPTITNHEGKNGHA